MKAAKSTQVRDAVVKGLQEYVNPAKVKPFVKPIHKQMLEINGLQEFNKGLYHNLQYENLIKYLVESRKKFRKSNNSQERKKIATEELAKWKEYVDIRKQELPEGFQLKENMITQVKQAWDIIKDRNDRLMHPSKLLDMHMEYTRGFKFQIPIDPRCLVQMIHPHFGYLSHLPNMITFDELIEIYRLKLVASYEKSLGQDILGNEISAYTYWQQIDKKGQGFMTIAEFAEFLKVFRFALSGNFKEFRSEFAFALQINSDEFSRDMEEENHVARFDFFRYIFLERNL